MDVKSSDNTASQPGADIDRVEAADWPELAFPLAARQQAVRVVFKQSVLNDIHQHGLSRTDVEVCGVLVGNGYRDAQSPFVYVEANIRGQHSDSQAAQVTFTGEAFNHIYNELDRNYPDKRIIGWYHTHPGFGIFLSSMDIFVQQSTFYAPHQIAFVFDPIGGDEGLFVWRGGEMVRDGYLIEPDAPADPPRITRRGEEPPLTAGAGVQPAGAEVLERLERIEARQRTGALALMFLGLLAIVGPIVAWFAAKPPATPSPQRTTRELKPLWSGQLREIQTAGEDEPPEPVRD